jgi:hypothetical protein
MESIPKEEIPAQDRELGTLHGMRSPRKRTTGKGRSRLGVGWLGDERRNGIPLNVRCFRKTRQTRS